LRWGAPPVPAAEGDLGDPLAGAEAVVDGAAAGALLAEPVVDAAAVVRAQMPARGPGRLVHGEVGRGGERQGRTAQPEAPGAVPAQFRPAGSLFSHGRQHTEAAAGARAPAAAHPCPGGTPRRASRAGSARMYVPVMRPSATVNDM